MFARFDENPAMTLQDIKETKRYGRTDGSHRCPFIKNYFFRTKLLHAYVQCVYIVKATYQIAPSKTVVGVDRPMKAPSMHIYKSPIREKLSKFSQLSSCQKLIFPNQTPSCVCSICLHCSGKASNCSIKCCGRS